jgi:hypothetical protein
MRVVNPARSIGITTRDSHDLSAIAGRHPPVASYSPPMQRVVLAAALAAAVVSCRQSSPPPTPVTGTVYFDAERAVPQPHVARTQVLQQAAPASLVVTPATRARGATTAAGVAALWHVDHNAARWHLTPVALANTKIALVHDLGHGAIVVKLKQQIDNLDVARTSLSVVMNRNFELVALSGQLRAATVATGTFRDDARAALSRALVDAGAGSRALVGMPDRGGFQRFSAPGLATARAHRVLFPVGNTLVPAWETEVGIRQNKRIAGFRHIHAADDGRLLLRASLTSDATFQYRVWADATGDLRFQDGPQGDYTPHPTGHPDGFDPGFVKPNLVSMDGFDKNHDPWLNAGATQSRGNNVDAYADLDFIDGFSAGDIRPTTTAPGVFDRTYDVTKDPQSDSGQEMAAIVEMFYVTNWLHDYWYDSGFNETAGNAQQSNFGRGGVEGDVLLAEGQDSSGTDNANMFTPADGESPRMQMFVFDAPPTGGPRRDGTIDNHVIAHEWGHYLHHRLVDCGSEECGAMSEGWGDFDAMFQAVRPGDNLSGAWGLGGYASRTFTANAAYFGIRRYPYSTDFTKSPLTFRFVQSGVPLPTGVATSDIDFLQGADNWEVHDAGEIWCAMLWEGVIDMLKSPRFANFEAARRQMADYIVAGMIAAPVEPSFTEQRDAILAAAAATNSADFVTLATAYARRGFGTGAISPDINSFDGSGVVESFQLTGALQIVGIDVSEDAASCDGDGILDVGETGTVTVTIRNTGAAALTGPTVSVSATTPGVAFPNGTSTTISAIQPFAVAQAKLEIRLDETPETPSTLSLDITASDASAALTSVEGLVTAQINLDVTPAASPLDSFEEAALVWTASPSGFARTDDQVNGTHVAAVQVAANGDHTLQTPALQVANGQHLVLDFRHRFQFGFGDGGVIEVSTNGVDFTDISTVAVSPPYNGTITGGPLAGRPGFTGASSGLFLEELNIDLGTSFGGKTIVLRFRAAGDGNADPSTWAVDDVGIGGLTNTPFPLVSIETGSCLPGQRPIADAGANFQVPTGTASALDGTASVDPDGGSLTFEWNQLSGPMIQLSSNTVAQPTFTAPATLVNRVASFQLVVRDPDARVSAPSDVSITILAAGSVDGPPDAAVVADAPTDSPEPDGQPVDHPDAGSPLEGGDGGGCCDAGADPRAAWTLALGVIALLGRRRRR